MTRNVVVQFSSFLTKLSSYCNIANPLFLTGTEAVKK